MTLPLSPELFWLAATAGLTALLWIPHILSLIVQMGFIPALMDGEHETSLQTRWARRAQRAHANAVANLAVFAPLVIAVHVAGQSSSLTSGACMMFFFARTAHYVVYALGLPLLRTLLFFVGVACQILLASRLLQFV